MLTAVGAAGIAAVASLIGVTLGALLEREFLPTPVREASAAFDRAIEEFALVARKHTS